MPGARANQDYAGNNYPIVDVIHFGVSLHPPVTSKARTTLSFGLSTLSLRSALRTTRTLATPKPEEPIFKMRMMPMPFFVEVLLIERA